MQKKILSSLLMTTFLFFSGCGSDSNTTQTPSQTTQQDTTSDKVVARVNHVVVEAGKAVDFSITNSDKVTSVEWRDKNGKLLSTDPNFNRLLTQEGEYETILTATDIDGNVITDKVVVRVTQAPASTETIPNQPPVVKAKAQSLDILDEESIHLSDDGSYDPDGSIVKYEWRDMDGILLSSTKKLDRKMYYYPQYDFNNNSTTRYVKTLIVTDDKGAISSKSFTIIVHKKPSTNQAPAVYAGADRTITEGESVTFTATVNDSDGTIISYVWKEGSVVKSNGAVLTLSSLSAGTHFFTVTVTDDKGATASDITKVEVKAHQTSPLAPTEFKATQISEDSVTLSWRDNAENETSYQVYQNGTLVKTLPANTTGVVINGLSNSTTYSFVVKAVNGLGISSSNNLSVLTDRSLASLDFLIDIKNKLVNENGKTNDEAELLVREYFLIFDGENLEDAKVSNINKINSGIKELSLMYDGKASINLSSTR